MKKGAYFLLLLANCLLMFVLVNSIKTQIEANEHTSRLEAKIKEKLLFIRDLQKVYQSQFGIYAQSWKELEEYASNGNIYTIQKGEKHEFDPTLNREITILTYDTLNSISVLDSVFKPSKYSPEDLSNVPGFEGQNFVITTNTISYGSSEVETVQVLCPVAVNPKAKTQKLQIGSLNRPTLAGNWN